MKRYGPSRRRALDASADLRIFVRHPEKTFATVSTLSGSPYRRRSGLTGYGADELFSKRVRGLIARAQAGLLSVA